MKIKSAAAAFAVFILVLGFFLYIEYFQKEEFKNESTGQNIPLIRVDKPSIKSFKITQGEIYVECKRNPKWKWALVKKDGVLVPANPDSVDTLLSNLCILDAFKAVTNDKKELEKFGLNLNTISKIELEFENTKPIIIIFGSDNPFHTGVYTTVNSLQGIFLCDPSVREKYIKNVNDLREYRLLIGDKDTFENITMMHDKTLLEMVKKEKDWLVDIDGILKSTDPDLVDSICDKLLNFNGYISVDDYPENLNTYGLSNPSSFIKIKEGDKVKTIWFGALTDDGKGLFANSNYSQVVYKVDKDSWDFVMRTPDQVREKLLNRFKAKFIDKIKIIKGKNIFEMEKDMKIMEWIFTKPSEFIVDVDLINNILFDLEQAKGKKIFPLNETGYKFYGLDKPDVVVILFDREMDLEYKFIFGEKIEEDFIAATNSKKEDVFFIQATTIARIPDNIITGLRSKKLFKMRTYTSNKFIYSFKNVHFECRMDSEGRWVSIKPEKKSLGDIYKGVLEEIDKLQISEFVDNQPEDLTKYGLKSKLSFIKLMDDTNLSECLYIGNKFKEKDLIYVRIEPGKAVYGIKRESLDKINVLLADIINNNS